MFGLGAAPRIYFGARRERGAGGEGARGEREEPGYLHWLRGGRVRPEHPDSI